MVPHIHHDVKQVIESPQEGELVSLALVVDEDAIGGATAFVRSNGGEVKDILPGGVVTIGIPEVKVEALSNVEGLQSISPDGELRVLA